MKFGISLFPLRPRQMVDVAVAAERLGYDSVWLGEHVVTPIHSDSTFPYAEDDAHAAFHGQLPFYDPFAALGYLAAQTSTLRLVLSISIVPVHDPFHLARSVTTLDLFSEGRFWFGMGAGWLREEFEILQKPFDGRGRILDETIDIMNRLFTQDVTTYRGRHFTVPPVGLQPKPLTRPHPPYLFGGHSRKALERAAARGQGWLSSGMSPERNAEAIAFLRRERRRLGVDDQPFECSTHLVGPVDRGLVDAYREAGVDRLVVRPWRKGGQAVEAITRLADDLGVTRTDRVTDCSTHTI
ncbi:LLM class F420-dependent oxidoreductase [Mycolicibacterium thermoresistibile]|uniref:F420-dependent oxidoreductase n=2 Tax=Mycolicibacterium thermoresistibile TaxID=1797 RepID=G7CKG7_MYCT3|nr:LLM class F420-dependent oxidoreductase [Mycolicibacterium thermoresistibile]EHI11677.1 F420-dependent oxidoreductase [Mycolicibacterium thermoresistibile ATCC 19527]MCV7187896.1 LLM class F420-dependent oxidoreductase [Mycolicibacterium thermoresistibile]GAT16035.1 F420-dependent oxidoreductase [Mycolicibacterium thermoresistibile]SNW17000.1 Luciferase family protein [Mycolicibacterium thermoresistibile]